MTEDRYTSALSGGRLRLTAPDVRAERGARARLYVRWMPHLGSEAVALYELLRILPDIGNDDTDFEELAELLDSTPESVEASVSVLLGNGFITERGGWLEVAPYPPASSPTASKAGGLSTGRRAAKAPRPAGGDPEVDEFPERKIEVVRAETEGVSAEDYFRYMGTLPAPHIIEFLNGYSERDGVEPDVIRESLKIASERDARRVGYVRSILERWIERGVKTLEDVNLFEQDRKLRLVEQSGVVKGGATLLKKTAGGGVNGGADRQDTAPSEEDYRWFWE
ncbi:DnaD domain-containing protein [Rubrobacter indicoceani]|uniref:DnaD domain-containing protein n=1 Tax=Rubrobacter indicoceani TaxID=2051957 RepID=UPI000E5B7DC0|nr:DnaD domain protein [Rubrobacter indicoceani]